MSVLLDGSIKEFVCIFHGMNAGEGTVSGTLSSGSKDSLLFQNVAMVHLADMQFVDANTNIALNNATVEFLGSSRTLAQLTVINKGTYISDTPIVIREMVNVSGDLVVISRHVRSVLSTEGLVMSSGSVRFVGPNQVLTVKHLQSAWDNRRATCHIKVPIRVTRSIRPGTRRVVVDDLELWSHSVGVEMVFNVDKEENLEPLDFEPIIVKKVVTDYHVFTVGVKFRQDTIDELYRKMFFDLNLHRVFKALAFPESAEMVPRLVYRYFDPDKSVVTGFTEETSGFRLSNSILTDSEGGAMTLLGIERCKG